MPFRSQPRLLAGVSILAIACAAAVARYWPLLHGQPGGLYPDEASEGIAAVRILNDPSYHPVFIDENGGREALFAYLVAGMFHLSGATVFGIRATSAAVGVAGVVAAWPLLRRFGLVAAIGGAAWMAGSPWLIATSALGLRNGLTVPFAGLAAAALLWWSERPGSRWAFAAGFVAGTGLWTYQPLKATPLLVAAWLIWLRRSDRALFDRMWRDRWWLAAGYLVAAAPYVWTAVSDPFNYFGRIAGITPISPGMGQANFLTHTLGTLGMFFVSGDSNPRHDVAALPVLLWPLPVLAGIGAWRLIRERVRPVSALVLAGMLVYLLPPILAVEGGAPHLQRSLALAPFVAVLVGVGVVEAMRLARRAARAGPVLVGTASAAAILAAGVYGTIAFATRPLTDRYEAYDFHAVALAAAASRPNTVAIVGAYDAQTVHFLDPSVRIYAPGSAVPAGMSLAALKLTDLPSADQASATVYARDPQGRPAVWLYSP